MSKDSSHSISHNTSYDNTNSDAVNTINAGSFQYINTGFVLS